MEECTLIGKQFETIRYMESLDFAWPCEKLHGPHKILQGNTILPQRECEANRRDSSPQSSIDVQFPFPIEFNANAKFLAGFSAMSSGIKVVPNSSFRNFSN